MESLSPIDGRYYQQTKDLREYLSEYAFFRYRLDFEIHYFLKLIDILPELQDIQNKKTDIKNIFIYFNERECEKIKEIEKTTNHDVKALEYYIQEKFKEAGLEKYISFIHFGLTSQDVNTTANVYGFKQAMNYVIGKSIDDLIKKTNELSEKYQGLPMLSHTHGQVAVPTTLGKEFKVFNYRMTEQLKKILYFRYTSKLGGAVGNLNAHYLAYPNIDWDIFADDFLSVYNIKRETYTTQISNYDSLCNMLNYIKTLNNIINDLNIDCWLYISKNYLTQKINENEVGSSTMPHKVNPINFENSEGNITMANALIEGITRKLSISRLQRDLTDSTILRNLGSVLGYTLIAYKSTLKGLEKIAANEDVIINDLTSNPLILSEGIQTVLRKHGENNAYEYLKEFTRKNEKITNEDINNFINKLPDKVRTELQQMNVFSYIGNAKK
jgi:adenylosuccinate lyase